MLKGFCLTSDGMWQATCLVIDTILSAQPEKTGKCDNPQLPENRIFTIKVEARPYAQKFFASLSPRAAQNFPMTTVFVATNIDFIGNDDRLHGDKVNVHTKKPSTS